MPDFTRIVQEAYEEILERPADPGGLAHYNERMNQGLSEAMLREVLLRSEEYAAKNTGGGMALHIEGNRFLNARNEVVIGSTTRTAGWDPLRWPARRIPSTWVT